MSRAFLTALYPDRVELASWSTLIWHSIHVLNESEHRGHAVTIDIWHKNALYTLVHCEQLVAVYDCNKLVRERLGIAGMSRTGGELQLLYVHHMHAGRGLGAQLLKEMENYALVYGHKSMKVQSSGIGRAFYQKHGYEPDGPPQQGAGVSWNHPMVKKL